MSQLFDPRKFFLDLLPRVPILRSWNSQQPQCLLSQHPLWPPWSSHSPCHCITGSPRWKGCGCTPFSCWVSFLVLCLYPLRIYYSGSCPFRRVSKRGKELGQKYSKLWLGITKGKLGHSVWKMFSRGNELSFFPSKTEVKKQNTTNVFSGKYFSFIITPSSSFIIGRKYHYKK